MSIASTIALYREENKMSNSIDTSKSVSSKDQSPKNIPHNPPSQNENLITEIGGRSGPEPTRYGDWEKDGKCTDF